MTGYGQNTVMVAFQLEAPMLHTSSWLLISNVTAHMLNMHPRVNICLSDCSPWDDDSDGDDDDDNDEYEDVRSDRVSTRLSDHACISSTRGSSQHVAHEQLCTQSSRSRTAWGNLERPFRAVRTKGENVLSFYLSFLRFVSSLLWLVANDVGMWRLQTFPTVSLFFALVSVNYVVIECENLAKYFFYVIGKLKYHLR